MLLLSDFVCVHFVNPFFLKFLPEPTAAARAALPSPTSACWVFLCFRNPPYSDIHFRILNMRTWSFLCVRIHTGVGSTQHFLTRGKSSFSFTCAPGGIRTLVMEWGVGRSTNWAALHFISSTIDARPSSVSCCDRAPLVFGCLARQYCWRISSRPDSLPLCLSS